ncbi:hypothetical protein KZ483_24935 [Paenibacillus sp. sptzw28]|uniref:hypothetical protein n=1 Tax=Paenibacillus sp. sptzw28 TaxID=715179 RepID=UPI001C6E712F|nr:hypothetical protein [Paenibacillus sp. sptzw28]QYR20955.1 hypothetical protein KZ483_24935 [Paenibacillus sp. sptzw28]
MKDILSKYCVKTFGSTNVVTEIGQVTKVASRTIHVDWGMKTWIYQNKDFRWVPLTKEEFEKKYKKAKFSEDALKRALVLGLDIK